MTDKLTLMDSVKQGVYVIGTKMGTSYNFMTAAWITQVSFAPCRIVLAVDTTHYTATLIKEQGCFTVSVLAEGQEDIARICGFVSGRETDKSTKIKYTLTHKELPIVRECATYMTCKVEKTVDIGDHILFVAEIEEGELKKGTTLTYLSKDYF